MKHKNNKTMHLFMKLMLVMMFALFMPTQIYALNTECKNYDYNSETYKPHILLDVDESLSGGYNKSTALPQLLDQSISGNFFHFTNNADITDKTIMHIEFPKQTVLRVIDLKHSTTTAYLKSGAVVKIQASNDNTSWVDISTPIISNGSVCRQTQMHTLQSNNDTAYRYYRIQGLSGQLSSTSSITEVYFTTKENCGMDTALSQGVFSDRVKISVTLNKGKNHG